MAACGNADLVGSLAPVSPYVQEFPPDLPEKLGDIPLDGGRVQSIAVHPLSPGGFLVANQFGGVWKSNDGGASWYHVLSAVSAMDVAFDPDGVHALATLARDTGVVNGGGIWRSADEGLTWVKPKGADPPAHVRVPDRISGYGICFAPDDPQRAYAGTDYGVAVSSDGGATWTHHMLETASPVRPDRSQNAAHSVLALPKKRVLALARTGVHRSDDGGSSWRIVRWGDFSEGFKCADASPVDPDKVFIVQGVSSLLLYELSSDSWSTISLPLGGGRGPFVRVSRASATGKAIDIWVGGGVNLYKARAKDIDAVRTLTSTDWTALWRSQGLHDDSGYLGLDSNHRPVLYGSDGGLFRPTNADATTWARAALSGSGLNSYLITDLAGTITTTASGATDIYLYFGTQDNGLWASTDNGLTWPESDGAEGFFVQAPTDADADSKVTVAYAKIGSGPSSSMFSDAGFLNQRAVPNVGIDGSALTDMGQAFLISPGRWLRYRTPPAASPEVYVSLDNGAKWRHKATVDIEIRGIFAVSGPIGAPTAYAPFRGVKTAVDGSPRIGLIRFENLLDAVTRSYDDSDLIYLPSNGGLGVRATEFDWHAVFAVDPTDPKYIIAPDVINKAVLISHDGGATWTTDAALTSAVTRDGQLLFYDDDAYRLQITQISFDPHSDRILVGTRDAGVVISENRGKTWTAIPKSDRMRYITGFFFRRDQTAVVSTYGRGLWTIDLRAHPKPFPFQTYCIAPCTVRPPRKPALIYENVNWLGKEVVVFLGGRVNGLSLIGNRLKRVTVTPGTDYRRYIGTDSAAPAPVTIEESSKGIGFRGLKGCLAALDEEGVIKGIVLEGERVFGVISGKKEFAERPPDDQPAPARPRRTATAKRSDRTTASPRPYVFITTTLPMAGQSVLGEDRTIHVLARGFVRHSRSIAPPTISVDGNVLDQTPTVSSDGTMRTSLTVTGKLASGEHTLAISQEVRGRRRVATSTFVMATADHLDKRTVARDVDRHQ